MQTVMASLNEHQKSHLRASLAHVDELLSGTTQILSAAEAQALFPKYVPDASPVQQRVIADYAARIRDRMRAILQSFGVHNPPPDTGAVRAARTWVSFAQNSVTELAPSDMRGYGKLSGEAANELSGMVAELLDLLQQMEAYLAQGAGRDLHARLQRLESTPLDGRLLKELERVITGFGLVELRATLEALVDRLESPCLELAVFGRTNCGKSSLLNYVLGTAVLPVGVTPVTAVPLRIVYGRKPWGRAWFIDAAPESFDLGRLPEFAAEHFNPSNARHVTRITVELPAPILKDGIAFVDTPGVGSLAGAGAAETMAYLPRCDVGFLLIDAASSLSAEDVVLVDALHRSGASVMVLLTKADLVGSEDRWRTVGYLRRELESRTGMELSIHGVSVKGAESELCDHWMEEALTPCLREHRRREGQSLRRKLGLLRDAVIDALEQRIDRGQNAGASGRGAQPSESEGVLARALARLDTAGREPLRDSSEAIRLAGEILDEVAHNAAVIWKEEHELTTDAAPLFAVSLHGRTRAAASAVAQDLIGLRASLSGALDEASAGAGLLRIEDHDLPRPAGLPPPNESDRALHLVLRKPALGFLGLWMLRRSARRQLHRAGVESHVRQHLADYEKRLDAWRSTTLDEMRRSFTPGRDLILSRLARGSALHADRLAAMQKDLEKLRQLDSHETNESEPAVSEK